MPSRDELSLQPSIEPFALHVEELRAHLTSLWDAVKALQPQNKDTQRKFYDRSTEDPALQEGDLVYLHTPFLKKGKSKKLSKRWSGPYKIVRVINKQNVLLKIDRREVVTHTSRLKPVYHQEQPNNGDTPSDTDVASGSDSEPPSTNDQPSDRPLLPLERLHHRCPPTVPIPVTLSDRPVQFTINRRFTSSPIRLKPTYVSSVYIFHISCSSNLLFNPY